MHATRVATNGNDVTGWLPGAASPGLLACRRGGGRTGPRWELSPEPLRFRRPQRVPACT